MNVLASIVGLVFGGVVISIVMLILASAVAVGRVLERVGLVML